MTNARSFPALAVAATLCLTAQADAQQTRSLSAAETPVVQGGLRAGWRVADGSRIAGVELRLAKGWKTYWRAPGDSGIPPAFDWSGSENVKSARILWPRPEVFVINGLRSIGYRGDVVLPVEVTPHDPSRPVRLRAQVDLGVCRDVCMPTELVLDASISGPGQADAAIRAALDARPATAREAGLANLSCRVEPIRDGVRVHASMTLPAQGAALETVVLEPPHPAIWVSEAQVTRHGTLLTAVADMVDTSGAPFALDRSAVTVTILGSRGAVEHRGCPAP